MHGTARHGGGFVSPRGRFFLKTLAVCLSISFPSFAQTELTVTRDAQGNAILSWGNTAPSYDVTRSTTPDFSQNVVTLSADTADTTLTDTTAKGYRVFYYDVTSRSAREINRAAQLQGGLPQGEIVITEICVPNTTNCSASGQGGGTIAIGGKGFDAANLTNHTVSFAGKNVPALSTLDSKGRLRVTIPTEAISGPVSVSLGRMRSNELAFTVTHGSGYTNISSLAPESGTGSLFVADRGGALWEVTPAGTKTDRDDGRVWQTVTSNLTATDGKGSLFFCNDNEVTNNIGSIAELNSSTNAVSSYPAAGASGDDAWGRGLAAPNVNLVYFLDHKTGFVRRVPRTGGKDGNWGNVAPGFFSFHQPAGARYASPNLYVTSTNKIVRVSDSEAVTTLATGLSGAAGMDIRPTGAGDRWLLFAEKTSGKIRLMDISDSITSNWPVVDVFTGFTNPVAAVWGSNSAAPAPEDQGFFTYIATPTAIFRYADPRLEMFPREDIRVLISDAAGGGFPSQYQVDDGKVAVSARVNPPRAGVNVTFEVMDPDDPSPYETDTAGNDNLDPAAPKGTLLLAGTGTPCGSPCTAATDASGFASVDLQITDRYSGDNYVVIGRMPTAGAAAAGKTGVMTAWKRVYVEHDKMFRNEGQELTADAKAGSDTLDVASTSRFTIGEQVWVFDAANQDGEKHLVDGLTGTAITLNGNLSRTYTMTEGAYVGKVSDGFYSADLSQLYKSFDEAFVEFIVRADGSGPVPYENEGALDTETKISQFSNRWFLNKGADGKAENYIHVIGARKETAWGYGVTVSFYTYSYIFCKTIADAGLLNASTANHEVGHIFDVNPPILITDGHDDRCDWKHGSGGSCAVSAESCLMNINRDRTFVNDFCLPDLMDDDPGAIRRESDPIQRNPFP